MLKHGVKNVIRLLSAVTRCTAIVLQVDQGDEPARPVYRRMIRVMITLCQKDPRLPYILLWTPMQLHRAC